MITTVFNNEKMVGNISITNGNGIENIDFINNINLSNAELLDGVLINNVVLCKSEKQDKNDALQYKAKITIIKRNISREFIESILREIINFEDQCGNLKLVINFSRFRKEGYIELGKINSKISIINGKMKIIDLKFDTDTELIKGNESKIMFTEFYKKYRFIFDNPFEVLTYLLKSKLHYMFKIDSEFKIYDISEDVLPHEDNNFETLLTKVVEEYFIHAKQRWGFDNIIICELLSSIFGEKISMEYIDMPIHKMLMSYYTSHKEVTFSEMHKILFKIFLASRYLILDTFDSLHSTYETKDTIIQGINNLFIENKLSVVNFAVEKYGINIDELIELCDEAKSNIL